MAIGIVVVADLALIGLLVLVMSRASRLTPHAEAPHKAARRPHAHAARSARQPARAGSVAVPAR